MGGSMGRLTMISGVNEVGIDVFREGLIFADASEIFGGTHQTMMNDHIPFLLEIIFDIG
jgi:hypothetical protein